MLRALFTHLRLGHRQAEHETSHGSMSKTQWVIDGPNGEVVEVDGHKFASNDDGAPMLVSTVYSVGGDRQCLIRLCSAQWSVAAWVGTRT